MKGTQRGPDPKPKRKEDLLLKISTRTTDRGPAVRRGQPRFSTAGSINVPGGER